MMLQTNAFLSFGFFRYEWQLASCALKFSWWLKCFPSQFPPQDAPHAKPCSNSIRMTSAAVQQDTKGLDLLWFVPTVGFPRSGNAKVLSQGPLSEPRAPAALVPRMACANLQAANAEECAASELDKQQWPAMALQIFWEDWGSHSGESPNAKLGHSSLACFQAWNWITTTKATACMRSIMILHDFTTWYSCITLKSYNRWKSDALI